MERESGGDRGKPGRGEKKITPPDKGGSNTERRPGNGRFVTKDALVKRILRHRDQLPPLPGDAGEIVRDARKD